MTNSTENAISDLMHLDANSVCTLICEHKDECIKRGD